MIIQFNLRLFLGKPWRYLLFCAGESARWIGRPPEIALNLPPFRTHGGNAISEKREFHRRARCFRKTFPCVRLCMGLRSPTPSSLRGHGRNFKWPSAVSLTCLSPPKKAQKKYSGNIPSRVIEGEILFCGKRGEGSPCFFFFRDGRSKEKGSHNLKGGGRGLCMRLPSSESGLGRLSSLPKQEVA